MGIAWRESLNVGIEKIDLQHRELLERFNRLLHACEEDKGRDELLVLLSFLEEYVATHFRDEEEIQQLCGYAGYAEHRSEHEGFVARISKLKQEIENDGVEIRHVINTNNLLFTWLIEHISRSDKKMAELVMPE